MVADLNGEEFREWLERNDIERCSVCGNYNPMDECSELSVGGYICRTCMKGASRMQNEHGPGAEVILTAEEADL